MPYFITDSADSCEGWATIKEDGEVIGCHPTKQGAIDQMVAVSIAEGMEPGGERLAGGPAAVITDIDGTLLAGDRPIQRVIDFVLAQPGSLFVLTARLESERSATEADLDRIGVTYRALLMKPDDEDDSTPDFKADMAEELLQTYDVVMAVDNDPTNRAAFAALGIDAIDPADIPDSRSVDLRAEVPGYMARAAQRGLDLRADGFGGDGLTEQTIREARAIAGGEMSDDKVIRANAWAARHAVDLQAGQNSDPDDPRWPGAGAVAHYLWGIDPLNPDPARAWLARTAQAIQDGRTKPMSVEQRSITIEDFELRQAGNGMSFSGYAAVFDSPSAPLPFVETIAPGAFKRSLSSRNNVRMLLNHDTSRVLGTTRAKTLRLAEDSKGLHVEADLPETTYGRDLSVSMQRGDIDSMSFGFCVPKGGDSWTEDGSRRTLREIRLHEVSVVTFPAYEATSAQVRDYSALAMRAQADQDAIAEAMEALIDGSLTDAQADLLRSVVDQAAPKPEPSVPLSVLQKQLDLIAKSL